MRQCVRYQFDWSGIGGMSPDMTFGHQIGKYNNGTDRDVAALGEYYSTYEKKGGQWNYNLSVRIFGQVRSDTIFVEPLLKPC